MMMMMKIQSTLFFSKIPNEKFTVHLMGQEMRYFSQQQGRMA